MTCQNPLYLDLMTWIIATFDLLIYTKHKPNITHIQKCNLTINFAIMDQSFAMNMAVRSIRRIDPDIKDIIASATQVALYTFNKSTGQWEKSDTEGALFVYRRNRGPLHSIMIMNRLNITNVMEHVVKDFDCWVQEPFLLYKNSKGQIFGMWFFEKKECDRVSDVLKSLIRELVKKWNVFICFKT